MPAWYSARAANLEHVTDDDVNVVHSRMGMADAYYGADLTGLVCGYRFPDGGLGTPVDSAAAVRWLSAPAPGEFAWLHFSLSHAAAQEWLRANVNLPAECYRDLYATRELHIRQGLMSVRLPLR